MPGKQSFQWGNKCLQLLDEFVGLEVPSIPKAKGGGRKHRSGFMYGEQLEIWEVAMAFCLFAENIM